MAPADNTRHLVAGAQRRRTDTLDRAHKALQELGETGQRHTVTEIAARAGVSRSWLYAQAELRDDIRRLTTAATAPAPAADPIERGTDASLRQRLTLAHQRIRELDTENRQLRDQVARLHGQLRAARIGNIHVADTVNDAKPQLTPPNARTGQDNVGGVKSGERIFRLGDRPDPETVMSFVDAHDFSVGFVVRVPGIAASTHYRWRARRKEPSRRARQDAELLAMIDEIRGEHQFAATYGSPRVWLALRRRGVRVGRKRVEQIMRVNGRQGAYLRRRWKHNSTRQDPRHSAAPDLLGRDFTATTPNTKWVADLTRILTGEGVLWLASVRDAFSNKVVG